MLRLNCPHCGVRDEVEFRYRGDASVRRPASDADAAAFVAYVYERDNRRGWHHEWWYHAAGCRQYLQVWRHTVTHAVHAVGNATDTLTPPEDLGRGPVTGGIAP